MEDGKATPSSTLAWKVPWTEEPGGLWSIGLQRFGHDISNSMNVCESPPRDEPMGSPKKGKVPGPMLSGACAKPLLT